MRIRWTTDAANDLTHICDYTEEQNGSTAARRVAIRIHDVIDRLAEFPYLGRPGRKRDTRELVFSDLPFLAIYRLRNDAIEITRILHGAQKWP